MQDPVYDALSPSRPRPNRLRAFAVHIGDWLRTCADYYTAAALYEQLSRLPDSELRRRGLNRATLARDLCAQCERPRH
ncbi:MAG: hypothetical protein NW223_10480 [Hyphomicrobiaceae bacterium]|nr:hypothetical protein [Hyphomicrobiaceae bacterium]